MLPTGIAVDNVAGVQASCIDAANPCTFVRFEDVGIETILPNDSNKLSQRLRWLEEIREAGKIAMGMAKSKSEAPRTIPKIAIISPPCTHKSLYGSVVEGSSIDLTVRFIGDTQPHRAIPLTGALCTAVAAKIKGAMLVFYCTLANTNTIAIGHSRGRIQVNATMDSNNEAECATVFRTARRIFEG